MKKILQIQRNKSLLLLLLFSVAGLTNAFAQDAYDFSAAVSGNTLYFKITDATNHTVEVVAPNWSDWSGFTQPTGSIALPQTVNNGGTDFTITAVGTYAFNGCSGLTGITFPSSVTSIGSYAFQSSGITFFNLDGNIGDHAFLYCSALTDVTIGENRTTTVGESAFNSSALTSLTIGANVTNIGSNAFNYCGNLANVTYNATSCTFSSSAFYYSGNSCILGFGNNVTSVPSSAFSSFSGLRTISNWGGVTSIPDNAFESTGLTSITIPNAVTSLGSYAFSNCSNLTSITFGSGLTTTGENTCSGCTNLRTVVMPSNITTIGNSSFQSCTSLNGTGITWGNVTTIGDYAFYYCTGMTSISFPSSLNRICRYAFSLTGLTTLTINVPYIESQAFQDCNALETLTIGANVREFSGAFRSCIALESVTFNAIDCTDGAGAFSGSNHTCSLTIGDGVTTLPSGVFDGFRGLNNIVSWGGVTSIGDNAFCQTGFTTMEVPDAITSLGNGVFTNCTSLGSVSLGSGLTTTGYRTFYGCSSLTTVTLNPNITTIGELSFSVCTSLNGTGFTFGDIETIEQYAFDGCTGMTNFTFPSSLTTIGQYAFNGTRFTNLTINLATINNSTFSGITTLTTVTIGRNVTSISGFAFKDCTALNDVRVLSATPASGGSYMFYNTASDLVIYVPAEHITTYKNDSFWSEYADKMQGWMGTTITGYGNSTESDHWAFIAIPYTANTLPTEIDGLIATTPANYDLYRLAPGVASTWENYKAHTEGFEFVNGQGYLYASKKDVDIVLTGAMFADAYKDVSLTKGWNLVGNPYGQSAYIDRSYFKMNDAGDDIEAVSAYTTTAIPVCTGVVVQAASNSDVARFTYTAPSKASGHGDLQMTLSKVNANGNEVHDKAFVSFDESAQLGKFIFNENHAKLYISQNGQDYSIAALQKATEMPVNFKAVQNGEYLITVEPENVEMSYLHLIDNLTGADVDLLATPSYQFTAKKSDYPTRFRLVFNANGIDENSVVNESFAFVSDGQIVVNGEGTLHVIDMQGRQLLIREAASDFCLPTSDFSSGVYVLRLINGKNVKTQKIIIK